MPYYAKHLGKRTNKEYLMLIFYVLISIGSLIPFFNKGFLYTGNDILFNINRIEELVANLKNLNPVSFVSTFANNQVGIGTNIFYPSLWLYPFAFFRLIFRNPIHAIYVSLMFFNFLTCLTAHFSFKAFSKSSSKAFIFTNLYFFSTYRWINVLHRFDISESIAMMLMPLIFWAFYETCFRNQHNWPWLAVSVSLLLYAHILSFLITILFLILIFIINARKISNLKTTIVYLFYSITTFFILSIGFLYTFIKTYLAVPIKSPRILVLSDTALKPLDLLGSSIENTISKNGAHFNLGIISLVIIILTILFFKRLSSMYKQSFMWLLFCVLLTTTLFPWSIFQETSLTLLQFPWRIFIIANFFLCFLGVEVFQFVKIKHMNYILVLVLILLNIATLNQFLSINDQSTNLSSTSNPYKKIFNHKSVKIEKKGYKYLTPLTYKDDYLPINTKATPYENSHIFRQMINQQILISGRYIKINKIQHIPDGSVITLPDIKNNSSVSIPFYIYQKHNYRVWVNGKRTTFSLSKFNLAQLTSQNSQNVIKIKYFPSIFQVLTIWLSIIGFLTLIIYGLRQFSFIERTKKLLLRLRL